MIIHVRKTRRQTSTDKARRARTVPSRRIRQGNYHTAAPTSAGSESELLHVLQRRVYNQLQFIALESHLSASTQKKGGNQIQQPRDASNTSSFFTGRSLLSKQCIYNVRCVSPDNAFSPALLLQEGGGFNTNSTVT